MRGPGPAGAADTSPWRPGCSGLAVAAAGDFRSRCNLMEFQTNIIEGNKNPRARVVWAGAVLIFLSMVLMCMNASVHYGFWLFGAGVVVLIVGLMGAKRDVGVMRVSETNLIMGCEQIRVGEMVYPLPQVTEIVFQIEGYDGMVDEQGYASSDVPGNWNWGILNGMNNYLDFKFGDEKVEWQFYLSDPVSVQQLGELFKELYSKGIPFRECSQVSKRTFLFAPVSERQWEDLMTQNGYSYGQGERTFG